MAGLSTGIKEKLTITACTLQTNGDLTLKRGAANCFEVMMNPSGFNHDHSITYTETTSRARSCKQNKAYGEPSVEPKFNSYGGEKVKFSLVIDGTGVVNMPTPGVGSPPVKDQIASLKKISYQYQGTKHEPSIVQLKWGKFIFYGRLESMSVEYTLFKPNGHPLRAKVGLAFISYMSKAEQTLRANPTSPDLTHSVEVQAGENLPLICYRIYNDCSYYLEVAKFNKINHFRDIKPGTKLSFPPLR